MSRLKFENISTEAQIQKNLKPTLFQEILEYLFYFVRLFVFVLGIYAFVRFTIFDVIGITGKSMYPTFNENTENDAIYIDQLTPRFGAYRRGDVIVLIAPQSCDSSSSFYIKRVIGLPGEQVAFEGGKVYIINEEFPAPGIELDESYYLSADVPTFKQPRQDTGQRTVEEIIKEGEYYFLGDNRTGSADSRVCGTIKKGQIIGREIFRLTPEGKRGFFQLPEFNIGNQ